MEKSDYASQNRQFQKTRDFSQLLLFKVYAAFLVPHCHSPVFRGLHHDPFNNRLSAYALCFTLSHYFLRRKKAGNR
jgi:hypothetical protein